MLCDHEVAEVDKERQRGIQSQRWQESCRPRISDAGGTPHRTRQERQRLISKARLESSLWSAYACSPRHKKHGRLRDHYGGDQQERGDGRHVKEQVHAVHLLRAVSQQQPLRQKMKISGLSATGLPPEALGFAQLCFATWIADLQDRLEGASAGCHDRSHKAGDIEEGLAPAGNHNTCTWA